MINSVRVLKKKNKIATKVKAANKAKQTAKQQIAQQQNALQQQQAAQQQQAVAQPDQQGVNQGYNSGKDTIHIKKSKVGTFTKAAKSHGSSVQGFANKVLKAPKGKYSSAMRKKANFAKNAAKWNH